MEVRTGAEGACTTGAWTVGAWVTTRSGTAGAAAYSSGVSSAIEYDVEMVGATGSLAWPAVLASATHLLNPDLRGALR